MMRTYIKKVYAAVASGDKEAAERMIQHPAVQRVCNTDFSELFNGDKKHVENPWKGAIKRRRYKDSIII